MRYRLKDIFDLQMGKTPARQNIKYWDKSDCKWISIADLSRSEKYISNTKEKISDIAVKETGIRVIPANTVIMSFKLSIGKVAITADNMYSNEAIMAFNDKHVVEILPEYVFYMFKYMRWDSGSNNAVMGKTLNKTTISEIEIDICSIKKQQEIVAILDKMDNILSNKYKEIHLLDELVKARFVEMFGDPVINSMGWDETTVGDECFYIKDGPHKSLTDIGKENGGHPFISVRNIVNGCIDLSTARYISDDDYAEAIKKCHPEKGDILYSKGGTTGIAKLVDIDEKFANWVHVAVLKFDKTKLNGVFLENMLNGAYCYEQSQRLTKGIANRDLVLSAIAKIKLYRPPIDLQEKFADFVRQVYKSKAVIEKSLKELETLQASLMQKYFS